MNNNDPRIITPSTPNPHHEARLALAARLALEERQADALERIALALELALESIEQNMRHRAD